MMPISSSFDRLVGQSSERVQRPSQRPVEVYNHHAVRIKSRDRNVAVLHTTLVQLES